MSFKTESQGSTVEDDAIDGADDKAAASEKRRAYHSSIKMLSAREHSVYELTQKLTKREFSRELIEALILDLQKSGYQSDERFAEQYARQRFNKGYGPLSIRAKLSERGIDSGLAADALDSLTADWVEHAEAVICRKFRADEIVSSEPKVEAKIARFLQTRGFSSSVALRALKQSRQNQ